MLPLLLAVSLCTSAPMSPPEERTDEFWTATLNQTLHDCFDHMDPAIPKVAVIVTARPAIASTACTPELLCKIAFGRGTLDELSPEGILFLMGHEAAHIVLNREDFAAVGAEEAEYIADLLAIREMPSGACAGARALEWVFEQMPDDPAIALYVERIRQRRLVLIAHCAVNIADAQ